MESRETKTDDITQEYGDVVKLGSFSNEAVARVGAADNPEGSWLVCSSPRSDSFCGKGAAKSDALTSSW